MIDKMAGIIIMIAGLIGFFLAQSPFVADLLGGTIGDTISFYGAQVYWIVPVGFFLFYMRQWGPFITGIVSIAAIIILYVLLNYGGMFL